MTDPFRRTLFPVDVSCSNDGINYGNSAPFSYYPLPSIVSVEPRRSWTRGGADVYVTVEGGTFRGANDTALHCRFAMEHGGKEYFEHGTLLNSTMMTCKAPKVELGKNVITAFAIVEVTADGSHYTDAGLDFEFYRVPNVYSVEPPRGVMQGNEEIVIVGSDFVEDIPMTMRAQFGDEEVHDVTFVSSTKIVVRSPNYEAHISGTVRVLVSDDELHFSDYDSAPRFAYYDEGDKDVENVIRLLPPTISTEANHSHVDILGTNLYKDATVTLVPRSGNDTTPIPVTDIVVSAVDSAQMNLTNVPIGLYEVVFTHNDVSSKSFDTQAYLGVSACPMCANLTMASPNSFVVGEEWTDDLVLSGWNLHDLGDDAVCEYGWAPGNLQPVTDASSFTVTCGALTTPDEVVQSTVRLSRDSGVTWSNPIPLFIFGRPPKIDDTAPAKLEKKKKNAITITGNYFADNGTALECNFYDDGKMVTANEAKFHNTTKISVDTPSTDKDQLSVKCTNDGVHLGNEAILHFKGKMSTTLIIILAAGGGLLLLAVAAFVVVKMRKPSRPTLPVAVNDGSSAVYRSMHDSDESSDE